jgi:hypothetical protein
MSRRSMERCRFGGVRQREGLLHVDHALEDDGADRLRVAAQVGLGGTGAVGAAGEVDLRVAEPSPDLVDVVHRHVGAVEGEVGLLRQLVTALGHRRHRERLPEIGLEVFGDAAELAAELARLGGPALVDEDEVAVLLAGVAGRVAGPVGDRLARAATEEEDGSGLAKVRWPGGRRL